MQDKELLEQLQPHNLPHMADGSFNITEQQHAAILSLLSQQEVVVESDEVAALKAYPVSMGSFVFNKGSDDEIVQKFDENDDFREGFVAGCNHVRQQLSQQQGMLSFYTSLLTEAKLHKETCDAIKEVTSQTDVNFRFEWGKLIAYCEILKTMQDRLPNNDELPVEIDQPLFEWLDESASLSQQEGMRWVKLRFFIERNIKELSENILTTSGENKLILLKEILTYIDESAPLSQQQQQRQYSEEDMLEAFKNGGWRHHNGNDKLPGEFKNWLTEYNHK